jgi:phosphatidate cytidylyltransferase
MTALEARARRSDLPARTIAGVVMIAIASAVTWWGGWPFRLLVLIGAAVMLIEWSDMHQVRRFWAWIGVALLGVLLLAAAQYLYPVERMAVPPGLWTLAPAWRGFLVTAGLALLIGLASRRFIMAGGFLYIAVPAFALLVIDWLWFELVFWAMIVTWATDICAYFAGRTIGGLKLAPQISPNKTWAGLIGGMIGAGICGLIAAYALDLGAPFRYLGALMGALAQAGDLFESWLKRRAGIKDSGSILPGHGGVLDRLDGLLPVILATFLLMLGSLAGA